MCAGTLFQYVAGMGSPESVATNRTHVADVERYASGYIYHEIILIISAVTTTLCLIFTVSLMTVHLSNWVKPQEQKQYVTPDDNYTTYIHRVEGGLISIP